MFLVDRLILLFAVLLLLGILSSKLSFRLGVPFLALFVAVGMLAGSEGIGGIPFEDYALAHAIGTLALAVILFDGGLRTSGSIFRSVWRRGVSLATVGVVLTSLITGVAASWILDIDLLQGLLLGAIVGSTDAAAVFAVFRSSHLSLDDRLTATLEIESGSNDPMAIFLTIGLIEVILGGFDSWTDLLRLFLVQMGVGTVTGILTGALGVGIINRIHLSAAGLYPVLGSACGLMAFGLAASIGGSGFLSVYLAGIVLGNSRVVFRRGLFLFHDGLAWLGQLTMFVVLGLLSFPSRLAAMAVEGLLLAAVLTFVARPLAVTVALLPFRLQWRELVFVAWAGLKGAVPIVLAIFPLLFGLPGSTLLFDVVFFVVLVSTVIQGSSLTIVARTLGLQRPRPPSPPVTLEITSLRDVEGDIVQYAVAADSRAAGRPIRELALPDGAVIALTARSGAIVPPRGSTRIEAGDFVFVVLRPEIRVLVDRVFSAAESTAAPLAEGVRFPLRGRTTVGELQEFYGIQVEESPERTLDQLLRERLGADLAAGAEMTLGDLRLVVGEMDGTRVERVDLILGL